MDFLLWEFSCIIFVTVNLPSGPDSYTDNIINNNLWEIETSKPEAAIILLGDFNCTSLNFHNYYQTVNCSTRKDRTIDLCFTNIPHAYDNCYKEEPLGLSDHNLIFLRPSYIPKLKREKTIVKNVKKWDNDTIDLLKGSHACTDCIIFSSLPIDKKTDTISSYINFCADSVNKTKCVKIYPNNKPWITKDIKEKLKQKRKYIQHGDRIQQNQSRKS
jgi:hypothetical protein